MEVIWIALCAFVGAVAASLAGWADSQTPFDRKKFTSSAIRALVAAFGLAAAYSYTGPLTPIDLLLAFIAGSGIDVLGNRGWGAVSKILKPKS